MRPVHPHVPDKSLQRGSRGGEAFLPCQLHTSEAVSIEGAAPRWAPPAPRGAQPPQSIPEHPHPCDAFSRAWGSGAGRGIVRHKWFSLLLEGSTLPCPVPGTSEQRAQVSPVLKTISEQLALWSFRDRARPQHREEFEIQSRAGKQTPLR